MLFRAAMPRALRRLQSMRVFATRTGRSLKGYDELRCIFVHIPKCAGSSISRALFGDQGGAHLRILHYQLAFDRQDFEGYFKFTFVRNPWDRLVSAFHFLKDGGVNESDRAWAERNLSTFDDFRSFVHEWVRHENVSSWKHFTPQYRFVCEPGRFEPRVDFVGYFEYLAEDFDHVRGVLGRGRPLTHVNRGEGRRRDYRDYYTPEMRRIVSDVYAEDVLLFGYDFESAGLSHRRARAAALHAGGPTARGPGFSRRPARRRSPRAS